LYFTKAQVSGNFTDQLTQTWVQWDGEWYRDIINNGYDQDFPNVPPSDESCNLGLGLCQRNFAFFPLFPLSVKLVQLLIPLPAEVLGLILSNLYFVLGTLLLYFLAKEFFGKRKAFLICVIAMVFPASYVFSGLMSESLFYLLLVLCYYLAHKKHWLAAGLVGGLLSATRIIGILVMVSLLLLFWEQNRDKAKWQRLLNLKLLLTLALVPAGLLFFMLFLQNHTGDALAFLRIQDYWEKSVGNLNPLAGIITALINFQVEGSFKNHLYNLAYFIGTMLLFIWNLLKKLLPFSLSSMLLWILVPLSAGTTLALPRYLLPLFPVYLIAGIILSKNKYLAALYLLASSLLLLYLTNLYVNGNFLTA